MVQIPRVPFCCFVVPLRIGAFIVAAWMFVWMAYSGLSLMLASYGTSNIIWKILGVPFFLVAAVALYGAHAIYHEIPHRVATFVRLYLFSIIFYFLAQIVFIVAVEIAVASAAAAAKKNCEDAQANLPANAKTDCSVTYSGGFPIFGWLVPFVFAFIWQAYLYVCIRSYSLELSERNEKQPTTTTYNIGA